ncbi:TadE family protein [Thalassoglobus neptunius]|uniref:TadE family protein n=1 Tax=Thalassoglobus neptunius TaxID=1938619 RepID=UPI001E55A088|nr:TadE/TadG family type IV pilus assembly protein [Thalassoglobus neptunius]
MSLELTLVLPILLVMLFGLFEFALLFNARIELDRATRAGARIAMMQGVDASIVEREVKESLRPKFAEAVSIGVRLGEFSGDEVIVEAGLPMTMASPNLLWPIGYNLVGQEIVTVVRVRKE